MRGPPPTPQPAARIELAKEAIASWRHLAGLGNSANEAASVNNRREVASQAEFVLAR
jgi:hypothetical protein